MTISAINDVKMRGYPDKERKGIPIMFQNPAIRKMLDLAKVGKDDIFFDLGCGWAQNLIVALEEYDVKQAVGLEKNRERRRIALQRIERRSIDPTRCHILKDKFEKLLEGRVKDAKLEDATVVFYGLGTDKWLLGSLERKLRDECRLDYYYNCLFPEIMPSDVDFPFYVSHVPFTTTTSRLDWLLAVTQKKISSCENGEPSERELWEELKHDYDIEGDISDVKKLQNRMTRCLHS